VIAVIQTQIGLRLRRKDPVVFAVVQAVERPLLKKRWGDLLELLGINHDRMSCVLLAFVLLFVISECTHKQLWLLCH